MKLLSKLKQHILMHHRGDLAPAMGVTSIFFVMLLLIALIVLSTVYTRVALGRYTEEVLRCVEVNGDVTSLEVTSRMQELRHTVINVEPSDVSFSGTEYWINASDGRVQLNSRIVVTAKYDYSVSLGSWWNFSIPLKATSDGLSEMYWK